ncbi:fumarylacetoacetate hydrolase family protein [Streptomyces sp. NPDC005406]|uniref:fumarylacetoacetate hydrolase family protein n=1 Tax=Streptomyces sp. NPDC005406 TaxID=3155339 RepID=UPI003451F72B
MEEMGRGLPAYPTLFAKFADTLTGPTDSVAAVPEDPEMDWEGELGVVVGRTAYRVSEDEAGDCIAGFTVAILPLHPGDLILTGTPGGVGRARTPQVYLTAGDVVTVTIDGIGSLSTPIV